MGKLNFNPKVKESKESLKSKNKALGISIIVIGLVMSSLIVGIAVNYDFNKLKFWENSGQVADDDADPTYYAFNVTDAINGKVPDHIWVKEYRIDDIDEYTQDEIADFRYADYTLYGTDTGYSVIETYPLVQYTNKFVMFQVGATGYHPKWIDSIAKGLNEVALYNASNTADIVVYDEQGGTTLNQTNERVHTLVIKADTDVHESKLGIDGLTFDFPNWCWNHTGILFTFNVTLAKASYVSISNSLTPEIISGSGVYVPLGQDWTSEAWSSYTVTFGTLLGSEFEVISARPYVGNPTDGTVTYLAAAYV